MRRFSTSARFWLSAGETLMTDYILASEAGVKFDGNINSASLNSDALDAVQKRLNPGNKNGSGGKLVFDRGTFFIARPIPVLSGCHPEGQGEMATTIIAAAPMPAMIRPKMWAGVDDTPNAQRWSFQGATLDCRFLAECGVLSQTNPINSTGDSKDYEMDPSFVLRDFDVRSAAVAGVRIIGRSGGFIERVTIKRAQVVGFDLSFDTDVMGCQTNYCGQYGLRYNGSSCRTTNTKAFNTGTATQPGIGFKNNFTYNSFVSCEGQQNSGTNFDFSYSVGTSGAGLVSSDPAYGVQYPGMVCGYDLTGARGCVIMGTHKGWVPAVTNPGGDLNKVYVA